jgi:hypothetical protein
VITVRLGLEWVDVPGMPGGGVWMDGRVYFSGWPEWRFRRKTGTL